MVISNWVERKLEERRMKREESLIRIGREEGREEGLKEGFERGRAYEREMIAAEAQIEDAENTKDSSSQGEQP